MSLRILFAQTAALSLVFLIVSSAPAQQPNHWKPQGMQNPQTFEKVEKEGTVKEVSPTLQISTNTNQTIYVMVTPKTQVSVTGTAEQDYLKAGVNIEFVADLDKTHTAKDKIIHLLITTPTNDRPAGLFPPDFATPEKKSEKKNEKKDKEDKAKPLAADPGVGGPAPGAPRRGRGKTDTLGDDSSSGKSTKPRSSAPQFPGTFTVRGAIKMCKNNAITVSAGHGPTIKGELANDVTIDVDMADMHAVQRDDRIKISGFANPARPGMVMAESISVELANPLSAPKKHSGRPERPTKIPAPTASKSKKADADAGALLGGGK